MATMASTTTDHHQRVTLSTLCLVAASSGVVAHLTYFIRGYRVPQAVGIATAHAAAGIAVFLYAFKSSETLAGSLVVATAATSSYFTALWCSIIAYRLFFHPLRRFPGPLAAKVSKIYNVFIAQHMHDVQNSWVEKYDSSIIRVGR
jgi:hypothetical protein